MKGYFKNLILVITLAFRGLGGEIIEIYKILNDYYDESFDKLFELQIDMISGIQNCGHISFINNLIKMLEEDF